jgi:hypothetical protein
MAFTIDDGTSLEAVADGAADCVPVDSMAAVDSLCGEILGPREQPIVALTPRLDGDGPVLAYEDVRALVGPRARVYLIADDELLLRLRERLGPGLGLERGMARVWWPGARARCDAADHPLIVALADEPSRVTLEEFAQQFDLTRPRVRGQVRLIDDARALAERELAQAREQSRTAAERLRDVQIECHHWRARAERAEARIAAVERDARPD